MGESILIDENVAALEAALARDVSGEVRFDSYTRQLFATDASMYAIEPIGVVFPRDADDVAAAVDVAGRFGVPVLPRGAGTSLAGQTVGHAVILDLSRHMAQIVEIDPEERLARIQPGVVQADLNNAAGRFGLLFGPDTSTANRATIGGMIGNNSSGSHSIVYGTTIDHVESLHVVLSDASRAQLSLVSPEEATRRASDTLEGSIYRHLPTLVDEHRDAVATGTPDYWRRAGGYRLERLSRDGMLDFAKVVVGSEGTLITVTEAEVRLVPRPPAAVIAVGHFASVSAAVAATDDALECEPAAVELMDRTILDLSRQSLELRHLGSVLEGRPGAVLFVTFFGDNTGEAVARLDRLEARWRAGRHGYATVRALTPAEQRPLLDVRKASLGLLMAASQGANRPHAFIEDTAVDPRHLPEYSSRLRAILDRHGLRAGFYGHASVGCLHVRPFLDLTRPGQVELMLGIASEVRELVAEYGGSNSSEHGDGLARSQFNRDVFGDELYEVMRQVKGLFDPDNRMNPGKVVDAPSMVQNLRDSALPTAVPLTTHISFDVSGGLRGAADRCMRIGACRKSGEGSMCPSYMATREEEHSTRGRANALVKALSEPDPKAALGSERLHEILDLCLQCKACKSECPLSVDMATMKSEFLAHYYEVHGVPRRARVIGRVRRLYRAGSALAPLSNWVTRLGVSRWLFERIIGIDHRRPLPAFAALPAGR